MKSKLNMKNSTKVLFLILLLCAIRYPLNAAQAAVPHLINYQGKLTDSAGLPLEGVHEITFRIYDAEVAGSMLWEEVHSGVIIQKGVFSLILGSVTALDLDFSQPYWLAIQVGGDAEMTPRQRLASVGYAIKAEYSDSAGDSDTLDNKDSSEFIWQGGPAGGELSGAYPDPGIADGAISRPKLKTATGTVSLNQCLPDNPETQLLIGISGFVMGNNSVRGGSVTPNWHTRITLGSYQALGEFADVGLVSRTLPGGEYGFYPQARYVQEGGQGYYTLYVRQRYVTASGEDPWLFLTYDKNKKAILSTWYAPDHPSYGQGPNEYQIPHPFGEYLDSSNPESSAKIPDNIEIVLVDLEQTRELERDQYEISQRKAKKDGQNIVISDKKLTRTVSEIVSQEYSVDTSNVYPYTPRDISDSAGNHWDVERIPGYIKVRRLIKKQ